MEENKEQIAKLQSMLKNSKNNSAQLKRAVESLTQELVAKTQRIEELQAELASKNIRIQELDAAVTGIKGGETVALISDAGTPGISDPGFLVVRECVRNGIEVQCLPGATAFVPALVASGLPNEKFCFEGFLPQKKGRMTRLKALAEECRTMVFYESPHRLVKALAQFTEHFGCLLYTSPSPRD